MDRIEIAVRLMSAVLSRTEVSPTQPTMALIRDSFSSADAIILYDQESTPATFRQAVTDFARSHGEPRESVARS